MGHAAGSAVVWGTALQVGRSRFRFPMVSLEFFIDIILPAGYDPEVDSASNRNEYQEYFLGVKAADAYGWQPYHLHVPIILKSESLSLLEPSGPAQVCNGIALPLPLPYTQYNTVMGCDGCLNRRHHYLIRVTAATTLNSTMTCI